MDEKYTFILKPDPVITYENSILGFHNIHGVFILILVFLILVATGMAAATFIEEKYDSFTALTLVYNARLFELRERIPRSLLRGMRAQNKYKIN